MTTIASLGLQVDSGDAVEAKDNLDLLTQAGGRAEKAAADLATGFTKAASAAGGLSTAEAKVTETTEEAMVRLTAMAKASLDASDYHKSLAASLTTTSTAMKAAGSSATDWAAYQAEINARGRTLLETEERLAESARQAAAAVGIQSKELQTLLGKIDPATAAVVKLDAQVEQLGKHLDAGRITQEQYNSALGKIDKDHAKLQKTATIFDRLRLGTREAQENVIQLGNALSTGDWGSGVRSVVQLGAGAEAGATGLLSMLGPLALATAAVGGLAYAYYKGSKEQDSYDNSLILTGNYAGVSAGQLGEMARQVSATVGSTGQAAVVLALLAGNGKIAGESFVDITEAAVSMREGTGKAVGDTVAEFAKLADDPVKASAALNEQYHYLTASVYSQIVALEKQGDHAGAVKLATEQYADAINARTPKILENLSYWEKAYNAVARAADFAKNIGRPDLDADIEQAKQNLAQAQRGDIGLFQNRQVMIEFYTDRLTLLEDQKAAEADIAKWDSEQAKAQEDAVSAMTEVDALTKSSWTNEQKRADAIKEYRRQLDDIRKVAPNDPRLQQSAIDKNIANINDKFKDSKAGTTRVDLTAFNDAKNNLVAISEEYKNAQKELDAAQKAGLISQEEYLLKRQALIGNERDEVTAAYEAEIAALESAKGSKTTTAAQAIQLDQKIADARSAMVKAQKEADTELSVLATNEQGRLIKQARAVQTYTDALNQQVEALRLQGLRAADGLGLGDRDRNLQDEQNGITDRMNQQRLDLANQYGDGSRGMSLDEYNQKLAALNQTERDLQETTIANYDQMTVAQGDWRKGASSAFQNYLDQARDVAGQTKALFTNAFSSMEDSVVNFAMTGKFSFSDFTKSILADMARIATRQAASGLLSSIAGTALGAWFGGGASAASAGASGAASAAGAGGFDYGLGTASSGMTYTPTFSDGGYTGDGGKYDPAGIVHGGEFVLRREVVSQPGMLDYLESLNARGYADGGLVTPMAIPQQITSGSSGASGSGASYNFPISVAVDASGMEGGASQSSQDAAAIGTSIQQATKVEVEKGIAAGLRQGGAIWRAINGR